jgi:cytochrome c-type biogenesis protein CcmF
LALAEQYAQDPPPATFRVIVNPLVVWIWIGALVALGGVAFALWPAAEARRRVQAAYAARLGKELGTAGGVKSEG